MKPSDDGRNENENDRRDANGCTPKERSRSIDKADVEFAAVGEIDGAEDTAKAFGLCNQVRSSLTVVNVRAPAGVPIVFQDQPTCGLATDVDVNLAGGFSNDACGWKIFRLG